MNIVSASVTAFSSWHTRKCALSLRYATAWKYLAPLIVLALAFVSLRTEAQGTAGNPAITITAAPDPVRPGELVQYVITATNRSAVAHSFSVSAQVPNHTTVAAGQFAVASAISQNGSCGSAVSICPAGSTISWGFGNNPIAPGQSVTVQFAALVDSTNPPPNGTVIRSTATVVSSGIDSATAGVDVVVSSAGLSLGMVNASSPVAPGAALSYTLEFGNPGAVSAPAATLAVALPAGTSFVSATGGGALVGSTVQWDVSALPSGGTGQRQLVVQVDPTAASGGAVSAAADLRDAGTGASLARANAAATVLSNAGSQVLITATPDPVRPGELVQYVVTATNRSAVAHSFSVSAQVPNHTTVAASSFVGASCGSAVSSCPAGSTISWGFGNNPIAPGQSATVQFSALVDSTNPPPNGTIIRSTASVVSNGIDSAAAGVDVAIQGGASSAPVLSTDVVSLSFGSVQVGSSKDLTLTITNTGAGTLTGTATPSAAFSVVSGSPFSLGAGQSQLVTLRFTPTTTVAVSGQLSVSTNGGSATVQLSGTGTSPPAPILGLSTNVLVFPNTTINANSLPAAVTITNLGGSDLILGTASLTGANLGDFVIAGNSCSGVTLPPAPASGSSCTISISFGPTLQGTRSASLTIPSNAAGSPSSVSLSGTGLAAPAPTVTLSTSSLTFGSQTVGANSLPQSVTLTNTGNANLLLGTLSVSGTNPGDYLVVTNTCTNATLVPNATCAFSVSFQPTATGSRTASVAISSNAAGSPHSVSLSGTGAAQTAPAATLSTSSLTFNSLTVGSTSPSQSVVLTNSGTANLVLGVLTLSGANSADYSIATNTCNSVTLAPNTNCSFSVMFTPTATGARTASVSISSNAAGSPHGVSLLGTGLAPTAPAASLSTSSLTFGALTVGSTSASQSVVLTNSGTANLVLGALTLAGTDPGDYLVATNTCSNATLVPNGNCSISLSFKPTATGTRSASVSITSNATGSPHNVSLSGTGVAPTAPAATLSTSSLTFGSLTVGSASPPQSVVLTNSGTANLVLGVLTLSGANPGDFLIATNACNNATLAPNANCAFSVAFKPTATGTRAASVSIISNAAGSPHGVSLSGLGVSPTAPAATLSTSSLTFGSLTVGANSLPQSVVLTNTGTANLVLGALTPSGANQGDFLVVTNACSNAILVPSSTCTFSVSFQPTATGPRTASASITSNAQGSPHVISFAGTGTGVTPPPLACPNAPHFLSVDESRDYQNLATGGLYAVTILSQRTETDGSTSADVVFSPNPITFSGGFGAYRNALKDGIPFELQLCYKSNEPGCRTSGSATLGVTITPTNAVVGDFVSPSSHPTYRINWCMPGGVVFAMERTTQATEFLLYTAIQDVLIGLFPGSTRVQTIVDVAQFWDVLRSIPDASRLVGDLFLTVSPSASIQVRRQAIARLATDVDLLFSGSAADQIQDALTKYVIKLAPSGTRQFSKATFLKLLAQVVAALDLYKLGLAAGLLDVNVGLTPPIVQINGQ